MPKPPNSVGAFLGFDCADYPGDAFMQDWTANSPYSFAGYYLQGPCHQHFIPWEGHRATLVAQGWNLLVIYVGQQRAGEKCGSNDLTQARGVVDANQAADRAKAEGFAPGTFIYLDIETGNPFGPDLDAYLTGWVPQLVTRGFGIGMYCSRNLATAVQASVSSHLPAGGASPARYWVFGDNTTRHFNRQTSKPSDSKVAFATAWQSLTSTVTFGSHTRAVDESVALTADPSGPV